MCSRSVKLLDRMEDPEKSLMRDNWWLELRNEIKSHMEAFCCNCVVGYTEFTTMYEDLMVLSAMGTAANLDATFSPQRSNHMLPFPSMSIDLPSDICEQVRKTTKFIAALLFPLLQTNNIADPHRYDLG